MTQTLYSNIKLYRSIKDHPDAFLYMRDICPDNELTLIASYETIKYFHEELTIILKDYSDRINIFAVFSNGSGDENGDNGNVKLPPGCTDIDIPIFYTESWTEKCLLVRNKGNNAEILHADITGLDTFLYDQFRL